MHGRPFHSWPKETKMEEASPIIELAATLDGGDNAITKTRNGRTTIADIGCNQRLLSITLATLGRYKGVIGVDASSCALEDGALLFF